MRVNKKLAHLQDIKKLNENTYCSFTWTDLRRYSATE